MCKDVRNDKIQKTHHITPAWQCTQKRATSIFAGSLGQWYHASTHLQASKADALLALPGVQATLPQHAPHYQGNFNVHTKETVESVVLHKGHPNAPGRGPVLDVRGFMKKLVLLRLFLVFARVNGVIIAQVVVYATHLLCLGHHFVVIVGVVVDMAAEAAAARRWI
jgi:hypothetical protein